MEPSERRGCGEATASFRRGRRASRRASDQGSLGIHGQGPVFDVRLCPALTGGLCPLRARVLAASLASTACPKASGTRCRATASWPSRNLTYNFEQ